MTKRVVLIPGFNIQDGGAATIDQLADLLEGDGWELDRDEADYGYWNLWKIIMFKGKARQDVLERIVGAIEKADLVVAHSNGCNFGDQALDMLPEKYKHTKTVVWISAALDTHHPVPDAVERMLVLSTPWDIWVRLASYIPFNTWGRMGSSGYKGDDWRVISIKVKKIKRHSNWFKPKFVHMTFNFIGNFYHKRNL
jgi:hypothetical protein